MITAPGDMVVYCAGFPAIYGRQPLYFQDAYFAARAAIPAHPNTAIHCRVSRHPRSKLFNGRRWL
jgi:type IV secretion system protein VirD4